MNLIEQLGGYENVSKHFNRVEYHAETKIFIGEWFGFYSMRDLKDALLEYRRHNNIFEEFDMLVYMEMSDISKIYRMVSAKPNSEGYIWMMGKGGLVYENIKYLIHANDEEIKAGKRL